METSILHFDRFSLDLNSYELRESGSLVKLEKLPTELLILLAKNEGKLVTRDAIVGRLWGDNVFVDTRQGINTAVRKLRIALHDDTDHPRILQTVAGRGYRLLATVSSPAITRSPDNASLLSPALDWTTAPRARKALLEAVALVLVASGALGFYVARQNGARYLRPEPETIRSLAVLPLKNLSSDPAQEYLSDGLTDELVADLAEIRSLRVISRTSSMRYKATKKSVPEIARELNVDALVEGSVKRAGERIRIRVTLLHGPTDRPLWSGSYERNTREIAGLDDQIALAVAHQISGQLTTAEEAHLASKRPTNPRAYEAYLSGRYLWNERDAESVAGAKGYFAQALREDPRFALAYSGLAECYTTVWSEKRDLALGEQYALKALAVEPELAEGYASLGINHNYQLRFDDAGKELMRAIEINPNYVMAHHWYAGHLLALGRPADALAENDRALQLDPFSFPVNALRGIILISLHEFDRAILQFGKLSAISPLSPFPHVQMARVYWDEGKLPDALAEERMIAALDHSPHGLALLHDQQQIASAYAHSDVRAAQLKSAHLKEKSYKQAYEALDIALQYGVVRDKEKILRWVTQAVQDNNGNAVWQLESAPEFDPVRTDPRFRALLERTGLPLL